MSYDCLWSEYLLSSLPDVSMRMPFSLFSQCMSWFGVRKEFWRKGTFFCLCWGKVCSFAQGVLGFVYCFGFSYPLGEMASWLLSVFWHGGNKCLLLKLFERKKNGKRGGWKQREKEKKYIKSHHGIKKKISWLTTHIGAKQVQIHGESPLY